MFEGGLAGRARRRDRHRRVGPTRWIGARLSARPREHAPRARATTP